MSTDAAVLPAWPAFSSGSHAHLWELWSSKGIHIVPLPGLLTAPDFVPVVQPDMTYTQEWTWVLSLASQLPFWLTLMPVGVAAYLSLD